MHTKLTGDVQKGNAARRNLLAGLAIIPFGAAAYWLSRPVDDDDADDTKDLLPFDDGETEVLADRKPLPLRAQSQSMHCCSLYLP